MLSNVASRLKNACNALPNSELDRQYQSLSRLQQLLVLAVSSAVVLTVSHLLADPEAIAPLSVPLAFLTFSIVSKVIARYNER
jgi:hypothetical protein